MTPHMVNEVPSFLRLAGPQGVHKKPVTDKARPPFAQIALNLASHALEYRQP